MKIILALSIFLSSTAALHSIPEATPCSTKLVAQSFGPRPTTAPSIEELRKRQAITGIPNLIVAPDNTCGFENGISDSAVSWLCPSGRCAFATTPGHTGDMYCCGKASTASCEKRWTACVDSASISAVCTGNGCDSIQTVVCTSSDYPYCGRGIFVGLSVSVLYCASTPYSTDDTYFTSYIGHDPIVFTAGEPTTSTSSSSSTSTSSTSTSSSTTSPIPTPTPTPSPSPTPAPKSKTPIGPIVGGAVGGVAVIAFVVVAILFILRSKKRDQKPEGVNHPPPFVQDHSGGAAGAAGYNPYSPPPEKSPPAFQQTAYAPPLSPTYSQPSSPPQHFSAQQQSPLQQFPPQQYPPQQYPPQHFTAPHNGAGVPQELNSNPTSPRPESQISQNPLPTYVPYQPPVDHESRIHEVQ